MVREQGGEQPAAGHSLRIFLVPAQTGFDLGADPADRLGIEARLGQRQPEQLEGSIAMFGLRLEGAAEVVAVGVEAEADGQLVEPSLEGLAVQITGAFVEQAGHHVG